MGAALEMCHDDTATMVVEAVPHGAIPERGASTTANGHGATAHRQPGRRAKRVIGLVAVRVAATACLRAG
jgi:hypothetical protein